MPEQFEKVVDSLVKELKDTTLAMRKARIEEVCEEYILKHDKKPSQLQLSRLSDVLLREDLSNPDSYKVQREEYPFHSVPQQKRRKRKEFTTKDSTLDYMKYRIKENLSTAPTEK